MKLQPAGDTIAAVATPPGTGGIGIVRVSGAGARRIGERVSGKRLQDRRATFCRFCGGDEAPIDEGIALYFQGPRSHTGEDVFEAHIHGSPAALDLLLERIVDLGARPAAAGEFSRRAFLNGKRDLAQLEAVADLVNSASAQAARSAQRVLQGEFSAIVGALRDELKSLRALIEASLDFPDDEVDVAGDQSVRARVDGLVQKLSDLERRATQGARLREGIEVVIAGRPNVGKSSLLNRLAQRETAIVASTPGTTRDVVGSDILIDGIPLRVLDTAGLRQAGDAVEREGMRRARRAMDSADLVIVLVDAAAGAGDIEKSLLDNLAAAGIATLTAHNKSDLVAAPQTGGGLYISARTGAGMDALCAAIKDKAGVLEAGEDALVVRRRHCDAIARARRLLSEALSKLAQTGAGDRLDVVAQDLRDAHQALSGMTGEYTTEEMLGDIFARFCIGK